MPLNYPGKMQAGIFERAQEAWRVGQRILMHGLSPSEWNRNVSHLNVREVFNFCQWIFIELLLPRKHWIGTIGKTVRDKQDLSEGNGCELGQQKRKHKQPFHGGRGLCTTRKVAIWGQWGLSRLKEWYLQRNGYGHGPRLLWRSGWSKMTGDTTEL